MPYDPIMEELRPKLVAEWTARQRLLKKQNYQFLTIVQVAVENYLRQSNFQTVIMRVLTSRPGKFSATKWGASLPLDGEILADHQPAYIIDQLSAGFNGKDNVPGLRSQSIGRPGKATIVVIVSICREVDLLYHVVHLVYEDGLTHEPTDFYFDNRHNRESLDIWLKEILADYDEA